VRIVDVEGAQERGVFRSRWALISGDPAFFRHAALQDAQSIADTRNFRPWKDDYSSLFAILM